MILGINDFNQAQEYFSLHGRETWAELDALLQRMPIHLKYSDQAGIRGRLIFDPVGANKYIKSGLTTAMWGSRVPLPPNLGFFGTDIDFLHRGTLIEAQFSNYPFLANNLLRSEIFFRSQCEMNGERCLGLIIVTKAHMLPASNSTLYFEQAGLQLNALTENRLLSMPVRLVGLFAPIGKCSAVVSRYGARYSRDSQESRVVEVDILAGRSAEHRSRIELISNDPNCLKIK